MTDDITLVVELTTDDEMLWRSTLGMADIEAWATAHGWSADEIESGSVRIARFDDGYQQVTAYRFVCDEHGRVLADGDDARRELVMSPLRRSLPESIGRVIR